MRRVTMLALGRDQPGGWTRKRDVASGDGVARSGRTVGTELSSATLGVSHLPQLCYSISADEPRHGQNGVSSDIFAGRMISLVPRVALAMADGRNLVA